MPNTLEINMRLRCLIIEDEPIAQDLLTELVDKHPALELVGVAGNAVEALDTFLTLRPDILLLDIHLPGITGIDLLRSLVTCKPFVIITTAFHHHALEGYELNVVDYLLKPISQERLDKAVSKVLERAGQLTTPGIAGNAIGSKTKNSTSENLPTDVLTVKDGRAIVHVPFQDIILCESMDDYVKIVTASRFIMTLCSLGQIEQRLPNEMFTRVSRSCILRNKAIRRIDTNSVELSNGRQLVLSRTKYRNNVRALVQLFL